MSSNAASIGAQTNASGMKSRFLYSHFTIIAVLVRLGLIWWNPSSQNAPWLFSPALESVLIRPVETLAHAKDGIAIQNQFFEGGFRDAYQGSFLHVSPLVFAVLRPFVDNKAFGYVLWGLFLLFIDLMIAVRIEQIGLTLLGKDDGTEERVQSKMPARIQPERAHVFGIHAIDDTASKREVDDSTPSETSATGTIDRTSIDELPLLSMNDAPYIASLFYFCNPVITLASLFRSFQSVWTLFLTNAIHASLSADSSSSCALWLALACYNDLWFAVYLVPASIWMSCRNRRTTTLCGFFLLWSVCLQGLSVLLVGDSWASVIQATYGHALGWIDLSPNLSMQWYFCMQMFHRFRRYFVILVNGLPYIFITPLTVRFHTYPIVLVTAFWFIGTFFRPVQTLADLAMAFSWMCLSTRTLARMGLHSLFACCAIPVPISLYVLDHWLWLETGSGNANYIFFQCLAYNVLMGILFLDFCASTMKRDKAIRLVQKEETTESISAAEATPTQIETSSHL